MQVYFNSYIGNNFLINKSRTKIKQKQMPAGQTIAFCRKKDLLESSPETIFSKIAKAIKDKSNFLGSGCEGSVYSIPGTNYCIKLPHAGVENKKINYRKFFSLNLTEQDKINHIEAHLGDGAVIMKKINGTTASDNPEIIENLIDFPASSFNDFLKQISEAHNNKMFFDAINQNIIINNKNKRITAIDFVPENNYTYNDDFLPLRSMFFSLINSDSDSESRRIISEKILDAALDEFQPGKNPCLDISEFDFSDFLSITDISLRDTLNKKIKQLLQLKDMELEGENVKDKLTSICAETKNLLHNK